MLEEWSARRDAVVEVLTAVRDAASESGATELAARVDSDLIDKLRDNRFHLVVVGEFNHGKTTLVNALLGERVLPTGVTPTTAVIHHVAYGEAPRAEVVRRDGQREPVPFAAIPTYSAGEHGDHGAIARLEVHYPADWLRDGVVLVDTPGVNDLSLTRAEITYGYIPQADAVLFVLDAGQPVKESERRFLEEQLIGQSREKIVFLVAKSDIWSDAEREQALDYVRRQLSGLVDGPVVFAVSAQRALGHPGSDDALKAVTGHLTRLLAEQRGSILIDNALGEGARALVTLQKGLEARRATAHMSAEQLGDRIQRLERDLEGSGERIEARRMKIREEASAIKAWARRDLDRFCDEVQEALPAQLSKATADDVRQHLGGFLEQAFQRWAKQETHEVAAALEKLADEIMAVVRQDAQEMGRSVEASIGAELQAPTIEVDTFVYDVSVFAILTFGLSVVFANAMLGGLLIAAAPALAMWNRDRTEIEVRRRGAELGAAALRNAAGKVAPKIDAHVDALARRLDAWVITTSRELHTEVLQVLRRAREARVAGSGGLQAELEACERASKTAAALEQRLARLRANQV